MKKPVIIINQHGVPGREVMEEINTYVNNFFEGTEYKAMTFFSDGDQIKVHGLEVNLTTDKVIKELLERIEELERKGK